MTQETNTDQIETDVKILIDTKVPLSGHATGTTRTVRGSRDPVNPCVNDNLKPKPNINIQLRVLRSVGMLVWQCIPYMPMSCDI